MTDRELMDMVMMMWGLKKDTYTISQVVGLPEPMVDRWLHLGLEDRYAKAHSAQGEAGCSSAVTA